MRKFCFIFVIAAVLLFCFLPAWAVTYPEMPVTADATCWSCHRHNNYAPVLSDQWSSTPVVQGNHPLQTPCFTCHNTNIQKSAKYRYCTVCHFQPGSLNISNYFSYRHTSDGRQGFLNLPNVRHNLAGIHNLSQSFCRGCHADTVTQEHARSSRTDSYGSKVTCDTCHTGAGLAPRVNTNGVLKIQKTQDYQIQYSDIYYAPQGESISRIRVTHAVDSGNGFEVHAYYNGKWGIVYYRSSGTKDIWFDLPYATTAVRTKLHAPYKATAGMWGGDVPQVELKARAVTNPRYSTVEQAVVNNNTSCSACHNAAEVSAHPSHLSDAPPFCASCHGTRLTTEPKRHNNDCASCHESINPAVVEAIRTEQTGCKACHEGAGHDQFHIGKPLDIACQTCHSATLTTEHLYNATTGGKGFNCDTCHSSEKNYVNRTIRAQRLSCASCHSSGHNVLFLDSVPADIPLYPSFTWTAPLEAATFSAETFSPTGYEDGQILISNRNATENAASIWTYFEQELPANGWVLLSGSPAADATYVSAEFTKEGRYVTVKCFNTQDGSADGVPLTSGYRIEIWYR